MTTETSLATSARYSVNSNRNTGILHKVEPNTYLHPRAEEGTTNVSSRLDEEGWWVRLVEGIV